MTRPLLFIAGLLLLCSTVISQNKDIASLKHQLENNREDTMRVLIFSNMGLLYRNLNIGTGASTGLTLYIIKTHAGEMKVQHKEGELTEFVIQLHGLV